MGFFNQLLQQLFPEKSISNSVESELLQRTAIKRSQTFLNQYENWIKKEIHIALLGHLHNNFHLVKNAKAEGVNFFTLDKRNAKGFYIRLENPWNTEDYTFLIHYFIQRLLTIEYKLNVATNEAVEKESSLLVNEFFNLKPSLKFRKELPYEQLFGNVTIEHYIKNAKTDLLKVVVTTYSDRSYKKAFDYEDFIGHLLSIEKG